jgi:glycosyltransferase involved in cell wall biosynthesis
LDELLPRLADEGHIINVVSAKQTSGVTTPPRIHVLALQSPGEVVAYLRETMPDIVHVHEWPAGEVLQAFAHSAVPRIVVHHYAYNFICPGQDLFWRRQGRICELKCGARCLWNAYARQCQLSRRPSAVLKGLIRVRRNLRYAQRADLFIALSNYIKARLTEAGLPEQRIAVLHPFTGIDQDKALQPVAGQVAFIGRVAESKGLNLLLAALERLGRTVPWSLVVAGDGYYMPLVKKRVVASSLGDRIRFVGWVNGQEKVRLLHEAAVVAMPSIWAEAFGIVGIEAMASGRPVVAFDVGGVRDWLTHGVTGLLAPAGDVDALARNLATLLSDTAMAAELGRAGRKSVESHFTGDVHSDRLCDFYEKIMKGTRGGAAV